MLEKIVRDSLANTRGTIYFKSAQLLAYVDDIDVIGRSQRDVKEAFKSLETEAAKMGLAVNEGKTTYMLSSKKDVQHRRLGQNVAIGSKKYEVFKDFVYLGSLVTRTTTPALR